MDNQGGSRGLTRVLLVDDHQLFIEALRSLLESNGIEVLGLATTGAEGLKLTEELDPDVVLIDFGLRDGHGTDFGRRILESRPDVILLGLTGLLDPETAGKAIRAGFHGVLTKDSSMQELVRAIDGALRGQITIPHGLSGQAGGRRTEAEKEAGRRAARLTPRELEVLEMLVKGYSSEAISQELTVSLNTVRTNIQNILMKLEVHSRLDAAIFAVRYKFVRNRFKSRVSDQSGLSTGEGFPRES